MPDWMADWDGMIAIFILLQILNLPLYGLIARVIFGKDGPRGFYGVWECFSEMLKNAEEGGFSNRDVKANYFLVVCSMLVAFECTGLLMLGAHHQLGKLFRYVAPYLQHYLS